MSIYIKLADFADCQKICDMQRIAFYDILTRYRDYEQTLLVKRWKQYRTNFGNLLQNIILL